MELNLNKEEVIVVLHALIEQKQKLVRMPYYPKQKGDIAPYEHMIRKIIRIRESALRKRTPRKHAGRR